ncbi:transferrin-binding protein-like solute binding protein [Parasphingorhabdus sp. JC815]|uniref:transferrin-binding protein-like solute binding protein n=1 Tax=Parasphingorhabdus sp. JC815 TaxID=3232140 RepID=UPI0034588DBA
MRLLILLASTTMLAACGGSGPQSVGSIAPPTGGGSGGSDGSGQSHTFVNPTEPKTYKGVGSTHSYKYSVENAGAAGAAQDGQLYQGNATTVRDSNLTIKYNPRDAIFDVSFANNLAGTASPVRFQDPLHRTDFGGVIEPQIGTPDLESAAFGLQGINYLEAGSSSNIRIRPGGEFIFDLINTAEPGSYNQTTFFYQTPGTETQYVTFAGYMRNSAGLEQIEITNPDGSTSIVLNQANTFERGALAYGEVSANDRVPTSGTGSFEGAMLATMVFNDQPDISGNTDTYFQWIAGRAATEVDFSTNTFSLSLDGTVGAPLFDGTSGIHSVREDARFQANGSGQIDLVAAGGFLGQFNEAWFVNPGGNRLDVNIVGSSVDGAFYGPNGEEIGGGYRIVGGTPDERIDILGTFVGKGN